MNCKTCGNPLQENDKFCFKCGTPVEQAPVNTAPVPPVNPTPVPPIYQQQTNSAAFAGQQVAPTAPKAKSSAIDGFIAYVKSDSFDRSLAYIAGAVLAAGIVVAILSAIINAITSSVLGVGAASYLSEILAIVIRLAAAGGASIYLCKHDFRETISFVSIAFFGEAVAGVASNLIVALFDAIGLIGNGYVLMTFISAFIGAILAAGVWFLYKNGKDFKKK